MCSPVKAETLTNMVSPPHASGNEALSGELLHHAFGVRVFAVDLVDRHHDRDTRSLRMLDRLVGLRHHSVVRRNDQDHDVGHPRPARPHRGERRVAGGVEKGERSAFGRDVVGADVLGDAARLSASHVGASYPVEQGGLSVVDVAHDGHHRRPRSELPIFGLRGRDDLLFQCVLVESAGRHGPSPPPRGSPSPDRGSD